MVAVAAVNTAPVVDDDVRAKGANDADHVLQDLVAPDFFRFLWRLGKTKIWGAGEEKLHTVAASGGEKLLCADDAQLRSLLRTESVLAAFATCKGEQGDVGMETAGEVSKHVAGFIVGMRGDVEDASRNARAVDGLDRFGKPGAGPRSGRKLRGHGRRESGRSSADEDDKRQTSKERAHASSSSTRRSRIHTFNCELPAANFQTAIVAFCVRE